MEICEAKWSKIPDMRYKQVEIRVGRVGNLGHVCRKLVFVMEIQVTRYEVVEDAGLFGLEEVGERWFLVVSEGEKG